MDEKIVISSQVAVQLDRQQQFIRIRDDRYMKVYIDIDRDTAFKLAYKLMSLASEL